VPDPLIGRRVESVGEIERPGDYCHVIDANETPRIYFRLPFEDERPETHSLYSVTEPPHAFRHCPDGSIEVRASIACKGGQPDPNANIWHGFLDEGHSWRTV
jgi:hypothetical protein